MIHPPAKVRRLFELIEPIATTSFSEQVDRAFREVGMRDFWDGYFAGRAAPLGLAPAEVVHAAFYNFGRGEVARHIPWVWKRISPTDAIVLRERVSAAALRHRLGVLAEEASDIQEVHECLTVETPWAGPLLVDVTWHPAAVRGGLPGTLDWDGESGHEAMLGDVEIIEQIQMGLVDIGIPPTATQNTTFGEKPSRRSCTAGSTASASPRKRVVNCCGSVPGTESPLV